MTNIQHITILQWELLDQTTGFQNGSLLPVMVFFTHFRLLDDEDIHWGVDYKCSKKLHCSRRWTPTTKGKIIHFEVLDSDVPFCMEIFHNKVSLFLMLDSWCSEIVGIKLWYMWWVTWTFQDMKRETAMSNERIIFYFFLCQKLKEKNLKAKKRVKSSLEQHTL